MKLTTSDAALIAGVCMGSFDHWGGALMLFLIAIISGIFSLGRPE